MQNELRAKFSRWIAYFVIVPGILVVLIANALLWRVLQQAEARRIETLALAAWGRVEQVVRAESVRVKTVATMPVAAAMLGVAQRRDAELPDDPEQIEARWRNANRSDMIVRAVLDNDVSDGFVRIRQQNPQFTDIILSDFAGFAVAATSLPEKYSQRLEPWWKFARSQAAGAVSTTGIRADGRADMVAGVMRAGYTNLADGLIRVVVNLQRMVSIAELTNEPTALVYVTGDTPWRIAGDEAEFTRAVQVLAPEITAARLRGWIAGYRYMAQPLAGDVAWSYPAYLVVAIPGAAIPLQTFLYLGGGLGLGAFAVFGMYAIARRRGLKEFLAPLQEAAEAGVWVLRATGGALPSGGSGGGGGGGDGNGGGGGGGRRRHGAHHPLLDHPWAQGLSEETSEVHSKLGHWLHTMRQELHTQSASISLEMKRDLELATDFQQAFLSRPYPQVPEVHLEGRLRLEFAHRYQAALAMGGDFFTIESLASDCAGVFVADVMGHGMRSALIVSILRTLIAELSRRGRNAPHFLRELNGQFCEILKSMPNPFFASAAYFVADTTARMATYAFAGHPSPFYVHRAVGKVFRIDMPQPQGSALGLIPFEEYSGGNIRLEPGDAFVFFTDGVYEAANRLGEEFGMSRLERVLKANVYKKGGDLLDAVMEAIKTFVGDEPVADDICLVVVEVTTEAVKKA